MFKNSNHRRRIFDYKIERPPFCFASKKKGLNLYQLSKYAIIDAAANKELYFENLSTPAREALKRESAPSVEFIEAKKPFELKYTFPTGEELKAWQNNEGQGFVIIERDGQRIFDLADLLPEGWKFVTPTYFKKYPDQQGLFDYLMSHWETSFARKMILLGEPKSPQDLLLSLLHEMGHANKDTEDELAAFEALGDERRRVKDTDPILKTLLSEEEAKVLSKSERRAWAWALVALRKIQKETGVDIVRHLFPSFDDLKRYVDYCLADYRRGFEWIIKKGYDPDFYKDLERYFDKWRYDRPQGGVPESG